MSRCIGRIDIHELGKAEELSRWNEGRRCEKRAGGSDAQPPTSLPCPLGISSAHRSAARKSRVALLSLRGYLIYNLRSSLSMNE